MNRPAILRLVFAIALLHLLADSAFAGGAVLCVESDDHRAVEAAHTAPHDPISVPDAALLQASATRSGGLCDDSLLHSEAELVSSWARSAQVGHHLALVLAPPPAPPRSVSIAASEPARRAAAAVLRQSAHRHTVLLI